ncbi:hypothetical protein H3Z83_00540 [Tenacibaculum sp. S7007]|uniref:Uncharacterized protein n=1 Tax=Tenacibaculum pelagium TaxID=2759527 RepID=A0A839AIJ6_9FLAO|nr:hypothetical protein [Tenacibaculum pelagium]MBA6155012.1 hypothetical protein [Tenacibaculum pelagium]
MKKLLIILFLIFTSVSNSQSIKEKEYHPYGSIKERLEYYEIRQKNFKDSDYKEAFDASLKKNKENLIKRLKGKWILRDIKTDPYIYRKEVTYYTNPHESLLEITNDSIFKYLLNLKTQKKLYQRKEKINFIDISLNYWSDCTNLVFSNNQIWRFSLTEDFKFLRTSCGEMSINGKAVLVSHIGENTTFYEKVK